MNIQQQSGADVDVHGRKHHGWPAVARYFLVLVGGLGTWFSRRVETGVRRGASARAWRVLQARYGAARTWYTGQPFAWRVIRDPAAWLVLVCCAACATGAPPVPLASTASRATDAPPPGMTPPFATPTVVMAAASTIAPAAPPTPPIDPALAAELQRILDGIVADGYVPGALLAVHIPGQEPWLGASGFIDRAHTQPMAPDTRYRIASITKIFTAVVVLQLAEEGRIDLDAPLARWLPELVPSGDRITVRHLLQHTSGLYDYLEDPAFRTQPYQAPDRTWTPRELVTYAARFPLAFQPGAEGAFDYSSTNYVILGMLIEQITGRTLAQEMRQRLFEPLGLAATFFAPDEPVDGIQAHAYSASTDLSRASMSFAFATANLVSTVEDVQRFAQALFDGQVLQPETLATMSRFVDGKGQYNMPALAYGLGLMRNQLPVGPGPDGHARPPAVSTVLGHTGGWGGFRSAVWYAPESGITIALGLNQADTDPNILATQVVDAILRQQGR